MSVKDHASSLLGASAVVAFSAASPARSGALARRLGAGLGSLTRTVAAALGLLSITVAASASIATPTPTGISFEIDLSQNYGVQDIVMYNAGSPVPIVALNPTNPWLAFSPGTTTISTSFLSLERYLQGLGITWTPGAFFLMGLTKDPAGYYHLALFTNTAWAAMEAAQPLDFGTLFPDTSEAQVIDDFLDYQSDLTKVVSDVFAFGAGDALSTPYGSIDFAGGDNFTVVSFSTGEIIGSGTSALTYAVPEPSTWMMLGIGFAGLGSMAYRGRKAAAAAKRA